MAIVTLSQAALGCTALCAVLTAIPGLGTTLVLRSALTGGRRRAGATDLGIVAVIGLGAKLALRHR